MSLRSLFSRLKLTWNILIPVVGTLFTGIAAIVTLSGGWRWGLIVATAVTVAVLSIPLVRATWLPYNRIWLNSKGSRRFLRTLIADNPWGVKDVTVVGVSCTDIAHVFDEVVAALGKGVRFRIFLVNSTHADVQPKGALDELEDVEEVIRLQKELEERLYGLAKTYGANYSWAAKEFKDLGSRLNTDTHSSHRTCIEVCETAWYRALDVAQEMHNPVSGTLVVFRLDNLPFARQWVFKDRAFMYSVYAGHPGVGTGGVVFYHEDPRQDGRVLDRAEAYVKKLESCSTRAPRPPLPLPQSP